ncbi:hypothetical protein AAur_0077 [Paenarthrobacter aurescens TC1]|uniref:Uncharacterized protein n=1 Tax=Paenarthrobacter aurescens (strain TC1) TaxID=290340 RepID=A1R0Z5_PAEAT|nr:hypothetical protein AAur_0077 [Paenarthrobacter aurescens TC1]
MVLVPRLTLVLGHAIRARPIRELTDWLPDPPLQAVVVPTVLFAPQIIPSSATSLPRFMWRTGVIHYARQRR